MFFLISFYILIRHISFISKIPYSNLSIVVCQYKVLKGVEKVKNSKFNYSFNVPNLNKSFELAPNISSHQYSEKIAERFSNTFSPYNYSQEIAKQFSNVSSSRYSQEIAGCYRTKQNIYKI